MSIKIGTDFSGIGAPEQAIKNLGIEHETVFACEIDKFARQSYLLMHNKPGSFYEDITKRKHEEIQQLDLYIAGFPCQSFSMSGLRKGFDDIRGTLFFDVAEFIKINQPKCFILENVKGLISHDNGRTYQTITDVLTNNGGTLNGQMSLDIFEDGLGYHVHAMVLNSKWYGVPQNRERIFLVGFKDYQNFSFPVAEPLTIRLKDILESDPDSKYNLSAKMSKYLTTRKEDFEKGKSTFNTHIADENTETSNCITSNYTKQSSDQQYLYIGSGTQRGYESATQGDSINLAQPTSKTRRGRVGKGVAQAVESQMIQYVYAPKVKQLNESIESGGKQPYQQNRLYDINGVCPSLPANLGGERSHNINTSQIRKLTPLECFRLQSFPDEQYHKLKSISDAQKYKQIGNSITVKVIEKIISKIYETT